MDAAVRCVAANTDDRRAPPPPFHTCLHLDGRDAVDDGVLNDTALPTYPRCLVADAVVDAFFPRRFHGCCACYTTTTTPPPWIPRGHSHTPPRTTDASDGLNWFNGPDACVHRLFSDHYYLCVGGPFAEQLAFTLPGGRCGRQTSYTGRWNLPRRLGHHLPDAQHTTLPLYGGRTPCWLPRDNPKPGADCSVGGTFPPHYLPQPTFLVAGGASPPTTGGSDDCRGLDRTVNPYPL